MVTHSSGNASDSCIIVSPPQYGGKLWIAEGQEHTAQSRSESVFCSQLGWSEPLEAPLL